MRNVNNTVKDRAYKNTSKSETVSISKLRKPFKVINGEIVECNFDGTIE